MTFLDELGSNLDKDLQDLGLNYYQIRLGTDSSGLVSPNPVIDFLGYGNEEEPGYPVGSSGQVFRYRVEIPITEIDRLRDLKGIDPLEPGREWQISPTSIGGSDWESVFVDGIAIQTSSVWQFTLSAEDPYS